MTSNTTGNNASVIDHHRTGKGRRWLAMTIIAHVRGRRMKRALGAADAARGMTVETSASDHLGVIHLEGSKRRRWNAVTSLAGIAGLRMG